MRAYSVATDSRESGPAMAIKKLRVTNFKSFNDLELELGQFNVLVGANASGKSNFVQIFRFLRDIARYGLTDALALQGDTEYLRNIYIGPASNSSFEILSEEEINFDDFHMTNQEGGSEWREEIKEVFYHFALTSRGKGREIETAEDTLRLKGRFFRTRAGEEEYLGSGELTMSNTMGDVENSIIIDGKRIGEAWFARFDAHQSLPQELLLGHAALFPPVTAFLFPPLGIKGTLPIAIYDFDPKLAKRGLLAGRRELEGDGSNLAIVLNALLQDQEDKRAFLNLMKDALPFVESIMVERAFDTSLQIQLKEMYSQKYLPAEFLSDGTMSIAALIVALFFEEKPFIIIEEPERHIHPYLISRVVNMLKEASEKRQVIITTHSPEIVKYVDVKDLLLLSRDKEGFSTISRPKDAGMVKAFLEHDLGVEELYVQNLLGV
jgi:predicted ATPase